jgi:hypothetical protein
LGFIHLTHVVTWHLNYSACNSDNLMGKATSEQGSNRSMPNGGQFPKGKSGNPGGRPAITPEVKELARQNAPKALERIVKLMDDKNPRIALAAASAVLDRAYGKPSMEERTVSFDVGSVQSTADVIGTVSKLLVATAKGELAVSDMRDIAGILELQRKTIEAVEMEARIKQLEDMLT